MALPNNSITTLHKLEEHLDQAKALLSSLSHLGQIPESSGASVRTLRLATSSAPEANDEGLMNRYRDAEARANRAEVQLSKIHREMDSVKAQAENSVKGVQKLAYQDVLTGLANLHLLEQHLDVLTKNQNRQVLILIIDIDRFAVINQVLGHDLGDQLLVRVGERLGQLAGAEAAVGRMGEDEFAVILKLPINAPTASLVKDLFGEVQRRLSEPFLVQGQNMELTVSGGACVFPNLATSSKELIQKARSALSHAKGQGRDQFHLYSSELLERQRRDSNFEFQLKYALDAGELFLEYLPLIWLERPKGSKSLVGTLLGAEALIRWRHRIEGVLGPGDFLPLAERTGQIVAIGEWILSQVCQQYSAWKEQGLDLFVNVNLSGRQLLASNLAEKVCEAADTAGVPRDRLTLEFHEDFGVLNQARIDRTLKSLQEAGFSLALDNFGDGASSLDRLSQVRFLKLSPRLVQNSPELCYKATTIASGLGLVAVGVGVETAEMARYLLDCGCSTVQGFYFSKPLSAKAIMELHHSKPSWKL